MNAALPRLVFFGTPPFAVTVLRALVEAGADIRLVVTQPDRRQGRGRRLKPPPVKAEAKRLGLAVTQPESLAEGKAVAAIDETGCQILVVVAYGLFIPAALLDRYPGKVINLHPSLLPKYRGAAPIQRAILNGDRVLGVTTMILDEGMDSGPILLQRTVTTTGAEPFGVIHDRLAERGATLMVETLQGLIRGELVPKPQEEAEATYAPPIAKHELRIDWTEPTDRIVNQIRAFDPRPGAYCHHGRMRLKCFDAAPAGWSTDGSPGQAVGVGREGLMVVAGDGNVVRIGMLQAPGGRPCSATDFVRGRPIPPGSVLT